ncbi:short chain dehydrogenase [Bradyrhizobium sp. Gha]|nr:short chain dehydrogenase [Bradyrhizobium sp. Gha]
MPLGVRVGIATGLVAVGDLLGHRGKRARGGAAFVTGAASGIGLALARALAWKGAKVMLADTEKVGAALRIKAHTWSVNSLN